MFPTEVARFPNSAELFKFCKEILYIKNPNKAKITDQDVGSLLDFDPADCTHWKHGRKNIKSIASLNVLAQKLEVDMRTIMDLVQGRSDLEDALLRYNGFGAFDAPSEEVRQWIVQKTAEIIEKADIKSLPVHIPELLSQMPYISLVEKEDQAPLVMTTAVENSYVISCKKTHFHGCIRFLIAREIAHVVFSQHSETHSLGINFRDMLAKSVNLFAIHLLMPAQMLQIATLQAKPHCDIVESLSNTFWLSRDLVNVRLKDFFVYRN